jgi:hypothetical protein
VNTRRRRWSISWSPERDVVRRRVRATRRTGRSLPGLLFQQGRLSLTEVTLPAHESEQELDLCLREFTVETLVVGDVTLMDLSDHPDGSLRRLDHDPSAIDGIPRSLDHAGMIEAIERGGHRSRGEPDRLCEPAGGGCAAEHEDVDASQIGPVQSDRIGDRLVEPIVRRSFPPDLPNELIEESALLT